MTLYRFTLIIITNLIFLNTYGQGYNKLIILAGQGIVYENDSILLYKTTIQETCKILKIKEPKDLTITDWDDFDSMSSGVIYEKIVDFKYLHLEFRDNQSVDSLKLISIKIKSDKKLQFISENGLELKRTNPQIKNIYPNCYNQDYITSDGLNYILNSYGITFKLDSLTNNNKLLTEISLYKKR